MSQDSPEHLQISFTYVADDLGPLFSLRSGKTATMPEPSKTKRSGVFWVLLVFFIATLVLFAVVHRQENAGPPPREGQTVTVASSTVCLSWVIAGMALILALSICINVVLMRGIKKKFVAASKGQQETVDFSAQGVVWAGELSTTQYTWGYFKHFQESPRTFILASQGELIHIIPKRVMTADQIDQLKRMLLQYIPQVAPNGG